MAGDVVRGRAPAVLRPALCADQRYEGHGAEVLFLVVGLTLARDLQQDLVPLLLADRNDEVTADRELLLQGLRHLRPTGRDEDGVERCGFGPAFRAVTDTQLDIVVTQRLEPLSSRFAERGMTLDGVDPIGDLTHHGRGIAGTGADFENAGPWPHLRRLDHEGDDIWLGDRLPFGDRQRPVLIREFLEAGLDEGLARHAPHGVENVAVADPAPGDLDFDHAVASAGEVKHESVVATGWQACDPAVLGRPKLKPKVARAADR